MAFFRSQESEEQRLLRVTENADRMAFIRSQESEEQRQSRLAGNAARSSFLRSQESDEQRQARIAENVARTSFSRSQESDEQRRARLAENAARTSFSRSQESDEQRRVRLAENAARMANSRSEESNDQRQTRLAENAARMSYSRSQESDKQRQSRVTENAARMDLSRSQESNKIRRFRLSENAVRTSFSRSQMSDDLRRSRCAESAARMASLRDQESEYDRRQRLNSQNASRQLLRLAETEEERCIRLENQQRYNDTYLAKLREFESRIHNFADKICNVCRKLLYKFQATSVDVHLPAVANILPEELKCDASRILLCNRCAGYIRRGRCPAQAYWNNMFLDKIPDEIECLTDVEKRLLSRIIPFVKIIKLGGRFGQYGFQGQAVLFGQDLEEVAEQLPLRMSSAGVVIVCEELESVQRQRQFSVNLQRLWAALHWLIQNNPLYRNVQVDYSNVRFDIQDVCHVHANINQEEPHIINVNDLSRNQVYVDIGNGREILRGSFHQGHPKFSIESRGKQCTAIAAVAIAVSKIVALNSWDVSIVDTVLIAGDRLYTQSIATRIVPDMREQNSEYLRAQELYVEFEVLSYLCSLTIESEEQTTSGHLTEDNTDIGFPNLKNGMTLFFEQHEAGILCCNGISIAIFKYADKYFLFDSHSRGAKGRQAQNGKSCLIKFQCAETLYALVKTVIPRSENDLGNQYTITGILVSLQNLNTHQNQNFSNNEPLLNITLPISPISTDEQNPNPDLQPEGEYDVVLETSVLRMIDDRIPSVTSVLENANEENVALRHLKRKTAPPLQMNTERRAEELGFFYLFPKGRNGLRESRDHDITPLDYCQARVMGADPRFQKNEYLFYALSVMEFHRARQNVGVVLRMRQGNNRPEGLVENIHLNMRSLRGSNAYWQRASSDLLAMVRNLGPPTWFLTFSCNDLNWPDILKALLVAAGRSNERPEDLSFEEKRRLVEDHPVALSRQFMVRVNALIRHLKSDDVVLGGKIEDYWYRVEFQNRGSPHLHMLIWIQDAPSFETPEGVDLIDNVVSCSMNTGDDILDTLVQQVQVHRHSETCYINRQNRRCRFDFPRSVSENTTILGAEECIQNRGRFCVLKRTVSEINVNNYNPQLLKLWKGNIDIQPCGNVTAAAFYITKYTSKHETQDVGQAVRDAVRNVRQQQGDVGRQLFAVSMAILNHRRVSACEAAYRLCHLKLRDSSRKTVFLNTCQKEERYRMLRLDSNDVHTNIFDRYEKRPLNLEYLSLAEFAVQYESTSNQNLDEDEGDEDVYREGCTEMPQQRIRLLDGTCMKRRRRNAVLRTKYYAQTADREGYFYSYLVAHVPFRSEDSLLEGYSSAEEAFMAKRSQLRPLQPGTDIEQFQNVQTELQQVIAQVLALGSEYGTNPQFRAPINLVAPIIEGYDPAVADVDLGVCDEDLDEGDRNISDIDFSTMLTSMNVEQKNLLNMIKDKINDELRGAETEDGLKLFITGGAGTGKTFVLKAVVEQIKRCYKPTVDILLRPCFVEVTALTGVAARLINGRTLHSALSLGIEKGSATTYRQLTGQRLEDSRRKWKYIRFLIIDEISMVSYEMLRCIHLRLQELKNSDRLFGGVNVLVFGDLLQLPPVKGSYCFKQPVQFQGEPHLWRLFSFCELKRNMRQSNDTEFVDLLNNLRVGQLNIEQYELLLNRTRVPLTGDFADGEAVRIYPTIKLVENYNNTMLSKLTSKMYVMNARDESKEPATYGQKPPASSIPADPNNTGGLVSVISMGIGTRVMLRMNIRVSEGLVNGSMGVVRGFEWGGLRRDQLEEGELPKKVLVEFDDSTIGRNYKNTNGWVGICPMSVTYQGSRGYGKIERVMIPLILSWAVTVHKLQGTTVDKAVVYLGNKMFAKGQAYVALSRVRSLDGVVICDLDQRKLFNNPHNNVALVELERLRNL